MSENRTPLLADLPHRVRERAADFKASFRQWRADVREDPSLLWRTTATRITVWLILGLCALVAVRVLGGSLLPVSGGDRPEQGTPLATLYVACTSADCYDSYITKQPMSFDAWPLTCRKCGQPAVYRARICPICHRWFATAPGASRECPFCSAAQPEKPARAPKSGPVDPDDAEDGW